MALIKSKQLDLSNDYAFTGGVTLTTAPSSGNDVVNKTYVDNLTTASSAGLDFKESVYVATTANLASTYNANVLTASGAGGISVDGESLSLNQRVLVKDQTTASQNGLYYVSVVGDGATAWQLTRSEDANSSSDLNTGAFVFIEAGSANQNKAFVLQANNDGSSPTMDTDALNFIQFSGAGQITAGNGIQKDGDTLALDISGLATRNTIDPANDLFAYYSDATDTEQKISVLSLFTGVVNFDEFDTSANDLSLRLDADLGLATVSAGANGGVGLGLGNMVAVTSGNVDANHHFVVQTATQTKKLQTNELLGQLAGDGLTANVTNFRLDSALPQIDSGSPGSDLNADGSATAITISSTPAGDSNVRVTVNGVGIELKGNKTGDAYFSSDAGTTARALADIASGDELIWNGASSYILETSDLVEIFYNA